MKEPTLTRNVPSLAMSQFVGVSLLELSKKWRCNAPLSSDVIIYTTCPNITDLRRGTEICLSICHLASGMKCFWIIIINLSFAPDLVCVFAAFFNAFKPFLMKKISLCPFSSSSLYQISSKLVQRYRCKTRHELLLPL